MPTLVEKIVAIDDALRDAGVAHAFGGALALAFHIEEPRGTRDIDVNVFAPADRAREVFAALPRGVKSTAEDVKQVERSGQVRLFWGDNPVDLFFSTHEFHERAAREIVEVPFADSTIPVLGATELTVFKAFFDRTKDWADIEAMVDAGTVDIHRALGWLVDLLGPDDERVARLRDVSTSPPSDEEPRFDPS
jgi:hypothetical protein